MKSKISDIALAPDSRDSDEDSASVKIEMGLLIATRHIKKHNAKRIISLIFQKQ